MTILHLWHSSGWRGGENQFRILATHLSPAWRGQLGAPAESDLARRLDGILPIHAVNCNGFLDIGSNVTIRRLVRAHGVGLIHAHDSHSLGSALAARIGRNLKVVASRRSAFPVRSGWKYRAVDAIVTVSEATARTLAKARVHDDRITIVSDAVDFTELDTARPNRVGMPEGHSIVLCVAAFSPEKDHKTLIEAWAAVEQSQPTAWLLLAGTGRLESELRKAVSARALGHVHFLGWRTDVPALVKGADIVVLSSREEGLGSTLCEAQAAGKPVIATRAGGIPEAIEDGMTGLLSPPGDAPGLAQNIIGLLADPNRQRSMGACGARRAKERFAPEQIAGQHEDLYRRLLGT